MNGAFGQCQGAVFPTPRDCSTDLDRDCDGRPDNTTDNVCTCAIGAVRECGTHPGLDGNGPCQAGSQRCEGRANNTTSNFGSCIGSVGPAPQDTCASGNDSNCNGIPNEGCGCINGQTRACGPDTELGICQRGSQTCSNGSFGQCQGAVFPTPRNCASPQDNDCNGQPDNTVDNVCQCVPGQGNGPCSDDPNNSRCNGQGQCVPCQVDADCSLVSGGRTSCDGGQCVGPRPFECSDPAPPAGPEPPFSQGGLNPPPQTGGVIANGRYTLTSITFFGFVTSVPGEVIDFRDGSYRRNVTLYSPTTDLIVGGFTEAGTYETDPIGLLFIDGSTCSLGNAPRSEVWEFTATGSEMTISSVPGRDAYQSYQRAAIPD